MTINILHAAPPRQIKVKNFDDSKRMAKYCQKLFLVAHLFTNQISFNNPSTQVLKHKVGLQCIVGYLNLVNWKEVTTLLKGC